MRYTLFTVIQSKSLNEYNRDAFRKTVKWNCISSILGEHIKSGSKLATMFPLLTTASPWRMRRTNLSLSQLIIQIAKKSSTYGIIQYYQNKLLWANVSWAVVLDFIRASLRITSIFQAVVQKTNKKTKTWRFQATFRLVMKTKQF